MDRKERARAFGSSLGAAALGFVGTRLNDSYGLPFVYVISLAAVGCLWWGWWPEIEKLFWFNKERRVAAGLVAVILVVIGAWASLKFDKKQRLEPPRLRITEAGLVSLPNADDIRINVNYINDGPETVRAVKVRSGIAATDGGKLSKQQEDEIFRKLEASGPDPNSTIELPQGATGLSTFPGEIDKPPVLTRKQLEDLQKKKSALYVVVSIGYFDKRNNIWNTQWCQFWDLSLPASILPRARPVLCLGHNGIVGPTAVE